MVAVQTIMMVLMRMFSFLHDEVGRGAVAVQMAQDGDEDDDQKDAQYPAVGDLDELFDQLIKHTDIGHDAKVGDDEDEQGGHSPGGGDAGFDVIGDVCDAAAVDECTDDGKDDEKGHGDGLSLQQEVHQQAYHDETCESEQHCFFLLFRVVFLFLAGERVGFPHKVSETGVELFRLVQKHQVAALVELVDLTVALHFGGKAVYHVQTIRLGLCAEYGVRNGDLFQIAEIIGQAEVVVQLQRRPGHRLFALGLEPGTGLIVHSLRTGNAGDEFVIEELGVIVRGR